MLASLMLIAPLAFAVALSVVSLSQAAPARVRARSLRRHS